MSIATTLEEDYLKPKYHEEEVSTELSHWFDYEPVKKKPRIIVSDDDRVVISHCSADEKDHEFLKANDSVSSTDYRRQALMVSASTATTNTSSSTVSTELELYSDPWTIKKRLTKSDLGGLSRLLIRTSLVREHVFPFMSTDAVQLVESGTGIIVCVWDHDTHSTHQLMFKKWSQSSKAYILSLAWTKDFVKRRDLKVGDQIGLFWDCHQLMFGFRVLDRIDS
ncbi:hypothetical protein ACOSQ3_028000 [Xanthoceras sorbifolium]